MLALRERPIPTRTLPTLDEFVPDPGSAYIYGTSVEKRSEHTPEWERRAGGVEFAHVVQQTRASFDILLESSSTTVQLRSASQFTKVWNHFQRRPVYLDITGLDHHVWAPLIRSALEHEQALRVVYCEPLAYSASTNPMDESSIFDLSEKIDGISPLPGFASLGAHSSDTVLVAMLGFEGARCAHVLESVQAERSRVIPIVGVPGFEVEYPFFTFVGNRKVLESTRAWRSVLYARASCPFSAMYRLFDVAERFPGDAMQIAMVGTKPHALGAVLFYLSTDRRVELIYDFPIRKSTRTQGATRVHVYDVAAALEGAVKRPRVAPPTVSKPQ